MNKSKYLYDNYEIKDPEHIRNFFKAVIDAGLVPSPETLVSVCKLDMLRLAPSREDNALASNVEGIALFFSDDNPTQALPSSIRVTAKMILPDSPSLRVRASPHIASQWNTARVGALLEQILDQLKIGNTKIGTDIIAPISKLAINGITADSKEIADLQMEVSSLKSANAIYEAENGRLMAAITEERNKLELELRKERAKAKSYRDQFAGMATSSASPFAAFTALEEEDRFLARRVLLAAQAKFGTEFDRPSDKADYMLSVDDVERQHRAIQMYIHTLCDALLSAREQQRVTLQMVKEAKNIALQCDKRATMAVDEELGLDHTINWKDIHPDMYEPYYLKLRAIYTTPSPETKDK